VTELFLWIEEQRALNAGCLVDAALCAPELLAQALPSQVGAAVAGLELFDGAARHRRPHVTTPQRRSA
jgi:hypothetical protein